MFTIHVQKIEEESMLASGRNDPIHACRHEYFMNFLSGCLTDLFFGVIIRIVVYIVLNDARNSAIIALLRR